MSEPTREERPQHNEERIEAIQAAMADDEFLSVARADDLRWLVKELAEAEQRRVDLVASLNEAGAFLMRVQAELHEASERATAAEAERDDERNMRVDRSLALNKALGECDQLRAELERERGDTKMLTEAVRAAYGFATEYARQNPRLTSTDGVQDPNGVHLWLERYADWLHFDVCKMCAKPVCVREDCQAHTDGSQLESGEWVCSLDCWDKAVLNE